MRATVHTIAERTCRSCTLCCDLPDIDELEKPANTLCRHCVAGKGCSQYEERPATCRDFLCAWMSDPEMGPEWDPTLCHMMVYEQGPQITVLVDKNHADAWKREPYIGQLQRRASEAEPRGGYVIVYVGDEVTKINPA
ncbi:MAG: hypothetical protein ACYC10_06065 [Allorhizobium sp.]